MPESLKQPVNKAIYIFFYLFTVVGGYLAVSFIVRGKGIVGFPLGFAVLVSLAVVKYYQENDDSGSIEKIEGELNKDLLGSFKQKHPKLIRRSRQAGKYGVFVIVILGIAAWAYMIFLVAND